MKSEKNEKKEKYVILKKKEWRELIARLDNLEWQVLILRSMLAVIRSHFYHTAKELGEKFKEVEKFA